MASYRLPFDNDSDWRLYRGNWDDPVAGHGSGQAYAFDFVHDWNLNGIGEDNQNVRATRAGVVITAKSWQSENVWGKNNTDPEIGSGNYVVIRHADGTAASYAHLKKDKVFVKQGDWVPQGHVIALSGNTGNSSTPHLHFDVLSYWNGAMDFGTSVPVQFEDHHHSAWRPRTGEILKSNNHVSRQDDWRWCSKCQGLFFGGNPGSNCPAGGAHKAGPGNYTLAHNALGAPGQDDWRWCSKCQGLFFGGNSGSRCPAGGAHSMVSSGNYTLVHNTPGAPGQSDWRWCSKCQGLFFSGNPGSKCPTGGSHAEAGSGDYTLSVEPGPDIQQGWRWCSKCQGLFFGGNPASTCPAGGGHSETGSGNYVLALNFASAPGQQGWKWCTKCQGLFFAGNPGSKCPAGGAHDKTGSGDYTLVHNAPNGPGQDGWRWCSKCQGLFFAGNSTSKCPAGGTHSETGSGQYRLARSAK